MKPGGGPTQASTSSNMPTISKYESEVRSCFGDTVELWYGGKEGKIGNNPNMMYIAIADNEHYWENDCVLRDWYFDYGKFKTLPLELDCYSYGVYVVWMSESKDDTKSQRERPCECGRPECTVVGGTCEWQLQEYEKKQD